MAVGDLLGVPGEAQRRACCRYKPLPHRMEFVGEHGAVCYLNDSKATNPDAVVRALAGQVRPVILIAGGKDKGFDYGVLAPEVGRICREVLLVGEAAGRLDGVLGAIKPCRRAGTVERAVEMAAAAAAPGDLVLLSPGCSSYDQFRNFEERGERFRQAVARLPSQPTPTRRNA
jgi:UDP-N-acetylmuramoylalanine--D-glutamate ligase